MGRNLHGAVGDGTTNDRPRLVRLGTDNDWVDVACGGHFALALKSNGSLWAWGENGNGQLGDGTMQDRSRAVRVGQDHNWTRIAAGPSYSLALKSDGTVWAWGHSDFSEWGHEPVYTRTSEKDLTVPTRLGRESNWTAIATTPQHTLLLKGDGTSWIWEHGGGFFSFKPDDELVTALGGLFDAASNNASRNRAFHFGASSFIFPLAKDWAVGLGEDGNIWLKGHNHAGEQLGPGLTAPSPMSAVETVEGPYWRMIRIGTDHVVAVKSDGSLWAWGTNYAGQIGNGTTNASAVPVRIGRANDWVWASAGAAYSVGLKADGSLWMWGRRIGGESKSLAWLRNVIGSLHFPIKLPPPRTAYLLPMRIADLGACVNTKFNPKAAASTGARARPSP